MLLNIDCMAFGSWNIPSQNLGRTSYAFRSQKQSSQTKITFALNLNDVGTSWPRWGWLQDHNSWFMASQCHGLWLWEVPGYTEEPSGSSCQLIVILRYISCSCATNSRFLIQRRHFPLLPYPLLTLLEKIRAPSISTGDLIPTPNTSGCNWQ